MSVFFFRPAQRAPSGLKCKKAFVYETAEEKKNFQVFTLCSRISGQISYIVSSLPTLCEWHLGFIQEGIDHLRTKLSKPLELIEVAKGDFGKRWKNPSFDFQDILHDPLKKWEKISKDTCSNRKSPIYLKATTRISKELMNIRVCVMEVRDQYLHFVWRGDILNIVCKDLWRVFALIGKCMVSIIEAHKLVANELELRECVSCHHEYPVLKKRRKISNCTTCAHNRTRGPFNKDRIV